LFKEITVKESFKKTGQLTSDGSMSHPGGVVLLVIEYYGNMVNCDKLWSDEHQSIPTYMA
jgi:hypothetical protein